MRPSNYDMSIECIGTAEKAGTLQLAAIEAMAAQTYATLAIVDELRAQRQDIRDTVAEEVSDALMDAKAGDEALVSDTRFVVARDAKHALAQYKSERDFPTWEQASSAPRVEGYEVFSVSVEVVQP